MAEVLYTFDLKELKSEELTRLSEVDRTQLPARVRIAVNSFMTTQELVSLGNVKAKAVLENDRTLELNAEEFNLVATVLGWELISTFTPEQPFPEEPA